MAGERMILFIFVPLATATIVVLWMLCSESSVAEDRQRVIDTRSARDWFERLQCGDLVTDSLTLLDWSIYSIRVNLSNGDVGLHMSRDGNYCSFEGGVVDLFERFGYQELRRDES